MIPSRIPIEQLRPILVALLVDIEQRSFEPALAQCHFQILEGVAQNFDRREDSHGGAWPPRRDPKLKHPMLRLGYSLYQAAATYGGPGQVEHLGARGSFIGISLDAVPYARAQNLGHHYNVNGRQWVLPAREYFYVSDVHLGRCDDLIAEYALTQIF